MKMKGLFSFLPPFFFFVVVVVVLYYAKVNAN